MVAQVNSPGAKAFSAFITDWLRNEPDVGAFPFIRGKACAETALDLESSSASDHLPENE